MCTLLLPICSVMAALNDNQVEFIHTSYGKTGVKLLHVNRSTPRHEIIEYEGKNVMHDDDDSLPPQADVEIRVELHALFDLLGICLVI